MDYNTYALTSFHHFDSSVNRRAPDMAIQHWLGILSQRRFGFNFGNRLLELTSLGNSGRRGSLPFTGSIIGVETNVRPC
jgi:hypothetical protein